MNAEDVAYVICIILATLFVVMAGKIFLDWYNKPEPTNYVCFPYEEGLITCVEKGKSV